MNSQAFDKLVAELEKDGGLDEARAWVKDTFYTADGKIKEVMKPLDADLAEILVSNAWELYAR